MEVPGPAAGLAADGTEGPSMDKIQQLLQSKDDTSRFVGLALLKSVLDGSADLQKDAEAIQSLWGSISPKFLDRLLRTGSQVNSGSGDTTPRDMLDLAAAVIHTFTILLPDDSKRDQKLLGRLPRLTNAVLYSSQETTKVIVHTLATLATMREGSRAIAELPEENWSSLFEIAPEHPHVLTIFIWAWEHGTSGVSDEGLMRDKIDRGIQSLISSFIGTDAVTLLEFISHVLRHLPANLIPQNPKWISSLTKLVRKLSTGRPAAAARSAYTNCAGALLVVYPHLAPRLLFTDEARAKNTSPDDQKSFAYLFVSLILVDIRATIPTLLAKLNDPDYPLVSQRLTSALDVVAAFIGQLVAWMEALDGDDAGGTAAAASTTTPMLSDSPCSLNIPPDLILKLSRSIAETLSVVAEFLRDRWDASVAGAQGLHPSARTEAAHASGGYSLQTLPWDALGGEEGSRHNSLSVYTDPLTLSSIRALALWLRDDDGDALRAEASGLTDMFLELYQGSSSSSGDGDSSSLDFRLPVLAALEGILAVEQGVESFKSHDGWTVLSKDLLNILRRSSSSSSSSSSLSSSSPSSSSSSSSLLLRGTRITVTLSILLGGGGNEGGQPPTVRSEEAWMDVLTGVAAYNPPNTDDNGLLEEEEEDLLSFLLSTFRLAAQLYCQASPGLRSRYTLSAAAVRGVAGQIMEALKKKKREKEGEGATNSRSGSVAVEDYVDGFKEVVELLSG